MPSYYCTLYICVASSQVTDASKHAICFPKPQGYQMRKQCDQDKKPKHDPEKQTPSLDAVSTETNERAPSLTFPPNSSHSPLTPEAS